MKKISALIIILAVAVLSASCSNSSASKSKVKKTTVKPTAIATSTTAKEVKIKKKAVKKDLSKATKPTEKAEKKSTTKATTAPPTQGKTKPNTHIVVTSIPKGSFSSSDLNYVYKKKTLKLNQKVEDAFKMFGEDYAEGEISKNRFEYEYDDFILTTYTEDDTERIDSIEVIGEGVVTPKGAKIGMYASRLKRLFGDANKFTDTEYVFGSGSKTLTFTYEGNIVTGFIYKLSH